MTDSTSLDHEVTAWINVAQDPATADLGPKILCRPDRLDPNIEIELVISRESSKSTIDGADIELDTITIAGTCWNKKNSRQLASDRAIIKDKISELLGEGLAGYAYEVHPEPGSDIAFFDILVDSKSSTPMMVCSFSRGEEEIDPFGWIA